MSTSRDGDRALTPRPKIGASIPQEICAPGGALFCLKQIGEGTKSAPADFSRPHEEEATLIKGGQRAMVLS